MRLTELEQFEPITIQCHDAPDGDAIGAGFGLYLYFQSKGKQVRLIYGGPFVIQKTNLKMLIEKLHIPIEYVPQGRKTFPGLLITIDCQYGAGNVERFPAEHVAIIDHHQVEMTGVELAEIRPELGSSSTLVWNMMREAGYDFTGGTALGTALYYGLFTDTNQFTEICNPLDIEMRENILCDYELIRQLHNSNLSLEELQIVGGALLRCTFNEEYHYALVGTEVCDANLLGIISNLLLQVDRVNTCLVYNKIGTGFKLSVRSCIREVMASGLAAYLTKDLGSGGGHIEKAGGFISRAKYEEKYPALRMEDYFAMKMKEYFDNPEIQ